jgi:hypothetical protein
MYINACKNVNMRYLFIKTHEMFKCLLFCENNYNKLL